MKLQCVVFLSTVILSVSAYAFEESNKNIGSICSYLENDISTSYLITKRFKSSYTSSYAKVPRTGRRKAIKRRAGQLALNEAIGKCKQEGWQACKGIGTYGVTNPYWTGEEFLYGLAEGKKRVAVTASEVKNIKCLRLTKCEEEIELLLLRDKIDQEAYVSKMDSVIKMKDSAECSQ